MKLLAQAAPANIGNKYLPANLQSQAGVSFFAQLISMLISVILVVGMIVFVFMLLLGGAAWISSGGDKAQVENARGRVTHALIGVIVLFSVWAVVKVVESIFGVSILSIDIMQFAIK